MTKISADEYFLCVGYTFFATIHEHVFDFNGKGTNKVKKIHRCGHSFRSMITTSILSLELECIVIRINTTHTNLNSIRHLE